MLKRALTLALVALVLVAGQAAHPAVAADHVVNVPNDDPEMAAAIAKARGSLATFWQAWKAPKQGEEGFSLKVRIPYGNGNSAEHFWLIEIERAGGKYSGIINNEPAYATQVEAGERYEFAEADISDWLFMRNGKMVGNETMRPLLKRMPKEQAEQYLQFLETP
jgi:uncharacterized protein YegJ (DUF2314 family)